MEDEGLSGRRSDISRLGRRFVGSENRPGGGLWTVHVGKKEVQLARGPVCPP